MQPQGFTCASTGHLVRKILVFAGAEGGHAGVQPDAGAAQGAAEPQAPVQAAKPAEDTEMRDAESGVVSL